MGKTFNDRLGSYVISALIGVHVDRPAELF